MEQIQVLLNSALFIAFTLIGLILLGIIVILAISLRHVRTQRKVLQAERMKALEIGQPVQWFEPQAEPKDAHLHSSFWIAFWVGAGVPIGVFSAAATSTPREPLLNDARIFVIWISAAVVGFAAVVSAAVIMAFTRRAAR